MKVDKHGYLRDNKGRFAGKKIATPTKLKTCQKGCKVDKYGNIHGPDGKFVGKQKGKFVSSKPIKTKTKTFVGFCVDGSGSMTGITHKATQVTNNLISEVGTNANLQGQETEICAFKFADKPYKLFGCTPSDNVDKLRSTYIGFMTALYDAVYECIMEIKAYSKPNDAKLMYVITDGRENASHNIDYKINVIKALQKNDNWTFVFMVPNESMVHYLVERGIPRGNIEIWEQTEKGLDVVEEKTSGSLSRYYEDRSRGMTQSVNFFGYRQC